MTSREMVDDPMYDAFLQTVKKQLAEKSITQSAAAKEIGVSVCSMNQYINRRYNIPPRYIFRLAKHLNISIDQITEVKIQKKVNPTSRTGKAIDILDRIFEKQKPMTWDQYEKLRDAITSIREGQA